MQQEASSGKGSSAARFAIAFIGNTFPPVVAIATAPLLAQALGVTGRGEVAAATAPLLLAITIATFGLPDAAVNAIARAPQTTLTVMRRAGVLITAAGLVAMVVIFLLREPLSAGSDVIIYNMTIAAIAVVPNLLIALLRSAAMGLHRWWDVTISRTLDSVVRLVAFIVLFITGDLTVTTATIVIALAPVVGGLGLLRVVFQHPRPVATDDPGSSNRFLLSFGAKVWIGAAAGVLLTRIDQLLMVPLAGAFQLGLYVVAVSISEVPLIANAAVREVMFASESEKPDDDRVTLASRVSTLITLFFALVVGLSMPWWLGPLFGDGFEAALPVAVILLVAVVAGNPGSVAGAALSARGYPDLRSISLIIAAMINVGVLVWLVPTYGAIGAGIATLVGNLIASNLNIYFLNKRCGVSATAFYAFRVNDVRVFFAAAMGLLKRGR